MGSESEVTDINEYRRKMAERNEPKESNQQRVTFVDPCPKLRSSFEALSFSPRGYI